MYSRTFIKQRNSWTTVTTFQGSGKKNRERMRNIMRVYIHIPKDQCVAIIRYAQLLYIFFDFPIISQIVHLSNQDISQDFHLATKVYSLMEHQFKIVKYIYDVQLKLEIVMYACKITRKPCDIHNVPLYVENHKTTTMKKFSSCIHIYMKCL